MSVKFGQFTPAASGGGQELSAKVVRLEEAAAQAEETIEILAFSIRSGDIAAPPEEGAAWEETRTYITGDVVSYDDKQYRALKVNQAKQPSKFTNHWGVVDLPEDTPEWATIENNAIIPIGFVVLCDGQQWVCVAEHQKGNGNGNKPKKNSKVWALHE